MTLLPRRFMSGSGASVGMHQEIGQLRREQEPGRTQDAVHAVVQGAVQATDPVLAASEAVDGLAERQDDASQEAKLAIHAQMLTVLEASRFLDLTGEPISKVVHTIVLSEERVDTMLRLRTVSGATADPTQPRLRIGTRRGAEDRLLTEPTQPGAAISRNAADAMFL